MKTLSKSMLSATCGLMLGLPVSAGEYYSNDVTPAGAGSGKLTAAISGKQVGGSQAAASYSPHAVILSGNAVTGVDLHPANAYQSMATCADDSQEGGWAYFYTGLHATVWSGSAASCVDLNPSGYNFSYCLGVHNGEQVGYAQSQSYFISASHAYCWHGSAASGVDLHTGTYPFSRALGCRDGEEVGYVSTIAYPEGDYLSYHTGSRAARWAGTAASAVDLHPLGFDSSEAVCTSGTQQGGWGYTALSTTRVHALLWSGTAESVLDLHPAAYTESKINAMNATQQVGEGWVGAPGVAGSVRHALAWSGTAGSVIDLNQYLPAGFTNGVATGIDADGNIVGYAYNTFQSGVYIPQGAVAVVFAPGQPPATQIATVTLNATDVSPGTPVDGSVSLGGPAPVGGQQITFVSTDPLVVATPATLAIPEGETTAAFSITAGGETLRAPSALRIYATDGIVSRYAPLTVTPVVNISSISGNPVEGGFSTSGTVALNIPAQAGGVVVTLASGDPSLLTLPASVTIPQGYVSYGFTMNTAQVGALTNVPITATSNAKTVSGNVSLNAAPVVALSGLTVTDMVGGQTITGTISLNNFPRSSSGAVISLSSSDTKLLQVPATVTVPYGAYSATFSATTSVVSSIKSVSVNATFGGGSLTSSVNVNPIPTVTITSASYDPVTMLFKVQADTSYANSILTFGTDAAGGPIGTMQFELGVWKGSILMTTAPTTATVWNSNGGQASIPVATKKIASGGGGGGSGGGGGGGTTTTTTASSYKLTIGKTGKGTVTTSPVGTSFAPGTVVTLTATPDAGSPWVGWSGDVTGTARTIKITMNKAMSVTANFK